MLINLWVRDKSNGHIHQIGTDVHDSIEYLCDQVAYVNMQSMASTLDAYEFVEPPALDDYVSVTLNLDVETAIRTFAERLKTYYKTIKGTTSTALTAYHIEQIAEEMIKELRANDNGQ